MDRFEALSLFVAVAAQRSFTGAARELGRSPASVTRAIAALEQHLGVPVLHRSTRSVTLTREGAALLDRARSLLADLRDTEQLLMGGRSEPKGELYITAPVMFGRLHVMPVLAELLEAHSGLTARMMLIDRNVRIVEEGIDVAVRIGELADSALMAARIGSVRQLIVASPAYLARRGVPASPDDLRGHDIIGGSGVRFTHAWRLGPNRETLVELTPRIHVNTVAAAVAAAEAGAGIANLLSYQPAEALAAGRLVTLFDDMVPPPLPVHLLYHPNRAALPAVRHFIDSMRAASQAGGWH